MDKINSLNNIVAIFQKQLSKTLTKKKGTANLTSPIATQSKDNKVKLTTIELEATINRKIKALSINDEISQLRASKVIIESILAWEFGSTITNDPKFELLIDNITNSINMDESLRNSFAQYINSLR